MRRSGDASAGWIRLGALVMAAAVFAGVLINRPHPELNRSAVTSAVGG
jgi:hypothetical protein